MVCLNDACNMVAVYTTICSSANMSWEILHLTQETASKLIFCGKRGFILIDKDTIHCLKTVILLKKYAEENKVKVILLYLGCYVGTT
jgi:hypothetical protein